MLITLQPPPALGTNPKTSAHYDTAYTVANFRSSAATDQFTPMIRSLDDIDGNGKSDFVVLFHHVASGENRAVVKETTGRLVREITFTQSPTPVDLAMLVDVNLNGAPELVVLSKGFVQAEVRDALSGELINTVEFDPDLTPVDLEILPDQDGNGAPELAVLGEGSVKVETKDALTEHTLSSVSFNANYKPKDLTYIGDVNGISAPELIVLGEHKNASKADRVEVRDLNTGSMVKNVWMGKGFEVQTFRKVKDLNGNGVREVAVLRTKPGLVSVLIKDPKTGAQVKSLTYNKNFEPIKLVVIPDLNGNGSSELGVLGRNPNTKVQQVELRDTRTGKAIKMVYFPKAYVAQDIAEMPDINSNGSWELVMLGKRESDGKLRAFIKDSKTVKTIKTVNF